jgi:hypothetical protein
MVDQHSQVDRIGCAIGIEIGTSPRTLGITHIGPAEENHVDLHRQVDRVDQPAFIEIGLMQAGALTDVADAIAIGIGLIGIEDGGAVVAGIPDSIRIVIAKTLIAESIAVVVHAIANFHCTRMNGAVGVITITVGAGPVTVAIRLIRIGDRRTIVTSITDTVGVAVLLAGIGSLKAIVGTVGNAIVVGVDIQIPSSGAAECPHIRP